MSKIFVGIISAYQYLGSPFLGRSCRFSPTCSAYAKDAIIKYGAIKGILLTLRRLLRCNPCCSGGYDPVP